MCTLKQCILLLVIIVVTPNVHAKSNVGSLVIDIDVSPVKILKKTPSGIFLHGLFDISDKSKASLEFVDFIKRIERGLYLSESRKQKRLNDILYKESLGWNHSNYEGLQKIGESLDEWSDRIEKLSFAIEHEAEIDKCEDENDSFFIDCEYVIAMTDYENYYQDSERPPLSIQLKGLKKKSLTDTERYNLERFLTDLMEQIRQVTIATINGGKKNMERELYPVKIKVVGSGLNIVSKYGSSELIIPEDVLRDIWARALFRALIFTNMTIDDLFGPGPYARTLLDIQKLTYILPGLTYPVITKQSLLRVMKLIKDKAAQQRWQSIYSRLKNSQEQDILNILGIEEIRSVLNIISNKSKNKEEQHRIKNYLSFVNSFIKDYNDRFFRTGIDSLEIYSQLFYESMLAHQSTSAEILKSMLFILAHESWHIWFTHKIGKKVELEADAHAMRIYLKTFPEIDFDTWYSAEDSSLIGLNTGEATNKDVFNSILGRSPDVILNEIYKGTNFYEGSWSHPSIKKRVEAIRTHINNGQLRFSDKIISLMECVLENADITDPESSHVKEKCYQ